VHGLSFDIAMITALGGALALAIGAAPLGVLLIGRRMSLVGDSLSHATLPGAAIVYVLAGPDPWLLTLGALIAGIVVAVSSTFLSRVGRMPEDAAFAVLYLTALAIGIVILRRSTSAEVVHSLLFGSPGAMDRPGLILAGVAAAATVLALTTMGQGLEAAADESAALFAPGVRGGLGQALLMALVALNLVAGFRAFGALMTVGLIMIPAAAARFWADDFRGRVVAAVLISMTASVAGLIAARAFAVEPGPAMVLAAASLFVVSALVGARRIGSA
jgi:zinc/manganese transport system permease protein